MTVGKAMSTADCEIHGIEDENLTTARLASVQQVKEGGNREPADLNWNIGRNLTPEECEEMLALLREFRDVFAADMSELGDSDIALHRIDTQGLPPVHIPSRRTAEHTRKVIDEELDEMLKHGIVRPSKSPYSSPVVIVTKKDGGMRFCIDYRRLNEQTKIDQYPLPRIDDALDSLSGARYFSTLDLASGYWQLRVAEEDIEKTAFSCYWGFI